ncbi:unnamed protein product [Arabidopsis lyrata]|nr:unnamed protein product [Arabidopsis lyrata]
MMVFDRRHLDRFIFGPPWSFNGRICGYQLDSRVLGLIAVVFGDPFERFWSWEGTNIVIFETVTKFQASKPNLSSWFSLMGSSPKSSNPEKKRRCKCTMNFASLFAVGAPEALVIGVVALLVFGPKGLDEDEESENMEVFQVFKELSSAEN